MNILRKIAIKFSYQFIPELYKKRFFKKFINLNWENIEERNVEIESLLIKHLLTENSTFIDVGANNGTYLYLAEKYTQTKQIIAFEPNPILFSKLKKLFPKVLTYNAAASNTNGLLLFKVPIIKNSPVFARGTLNTGYKEEEEQRSIEYKVKTIKIDDFTPIQKLKEISLIKIDVEGHELSVLEGAIETIKKHKPALLIEIEERHHQKTLRECIAPIFMLGYKVYFLNRNSRQIELFNPDFQHFQDTKNIYNKANYINNFFFLPEEGSEKTLENINSKLLT